MQKLGILASFAASAHGVQVMNRLGMPQWIAAVDDAYTGSCDQATEAVMTKLSEIGGDTHRRLLSSGDPAIEAQAIASQISCYVEFAAFEDTAKLLDAHLDFVVSVDSNEVIEEFEYEYSVSDYSSSEYESEYMEDPIFTDNNGTIGNETDVPSNGTDGELYSWSLDRADGEIDNESYFPTFDGSGQVLYVVDTGIMADHEDFEGRASEGGNMVLDEMSATDFNGHGTHCASHAVGDRFGVSPGAEVVGVKVLSKDGGGTTASVLRGVQWIIDNASQTSVISLSLGGSLSPTMNKMMKDVSTRHIVVVAAGNDDKDACDYSPASAGGDVITVGSTNEDDNRSYFSNYGPCVDVYAPGSSIVAAYVGSRSTTAVLSGTSMAAPYVAGVALQYLEKNDGNRKAALEDMRANFMYGVVGNLVNSDINLFPSLPTYTGAPTTPTISPTMPPTPPPPVMCAKKHCATFSGSKFGPPAIDQVFTAKMAYAHDYTGCGNTGDDYSGEIVMVMRGECTFSQKVDTLEAMGAIGVVFVNNQGKSHFPAELTYGAQQPGIPSCMVGFDDGEQMLKREGKKFFWNKGGSLPPTHAPTGNPTVSPTMYPTEPPTPEPTLHPTNNPTPYPTFSPDLPDCSTFKKSKCKKNNKRCRWAGSTKTCDTRQL